MKNYVGRNIIRQTIPTITYTRYVDTVDIPAAHTCHAIGVNKKNKDSPRKRIKKEESFVKHILFGSCLLQWSRFHVSKSDLCVSYFAEVKI